MPTSRDCRSFGPVDRRAFERLLEAGRARGLNVPAETVGVFHYKGFEIEYAFDEGRSALDICVLKKPPLIPTSVLWAIVEKFAARYDAGEFDSSLKRSRSGERSSDTQRRKKGNKG
jgi:hypothetical protein